jgi:hypothetical protein
MTAHIMKDDLCGDWITEMVARELDRALYLILTYTVTDR